MPDDQRKTTLGYAPPQQAKSLEDLAFMADLGIDDAYLSRGLYLLLQRAFLTGANVYLAHILDRSDDERLQTLYSARDQTEQALSTRWPCWPGRWTRQRATTRTCCRSQRTFTTRQTSA
jgi:hypothetical protein